MHQLPHLTKLTAVGVYVACLQDARFKGLINSRWFSYCWLAPRRYPRPVIIK